MWVNGQWGERGRGWKERGRVGERERVEEGKVRGREGWRGVGEYERERNGEGEEESEGERE